MYEPRHARSRAGGHRFWPRLGWVVASLLAVVCSFGLGFVASNPAVLSQLTPGLHLAQLHLAWPFGASHASKAPEPLIGPNTVIERDTTYAACNQQITESEPAPPEWQGMTQADLIARYPDIHVVSFTASKVVLALQAAGCPYHGRTIRLVDGKVIVYYGSPDNLGPVKEVTSVDVGKLTEADRKRLEDGIAASDDNEVKRILEGLGG